LQDSCFALMCEIQLTIYQGSVVQRLDNDFSTVIKLLETLCKCQLIILKSLKIAMHAFSYNGLGPQASSGLLSTVPHLDIKFMPSFSMRWLAT
jgi:hypothetical protein